MPGFDALYKQTITLFNRKRENGALMWYPFVISGVHLIMDKSIIISTYGEQSQDNARVHIQYVPSGDSAVVGEKKYLLPKVWEKSGNPALNFTLGFGDNFDFIMEGVYSEDSLTCEVKASSQITASVDEDQFKAAISRTTGTYEFVYGEESWMYLSVDVNIERYGITVDGTPESGDKIILQYVSADEPIADDNYKNGFYNYMNKSYDNVFAISTVSKFNLIPHFEIGAK